MEKFWEWMKEKGYSENNYPSWLHCGNTEYQPNKQMLIGYMMEYLDEIYKWNGKRSIYIAIETYLNEAISKIEEE